MKYLNILIALLISAISQTLSNGQSSGSKPPSDSFCLNAPAVKVKASEVQGKYYLIYASGSALKFANDECMTANYSLNTKGNIDALNCAFRKNDRKAFCMRSKISRAVTIEAPNGRLAVQFEGEAAGTASAINFNVAAVKYWLARGGEAYALAIYQCLKTVRGNESGFYIFARQVFNRRHLLNTFAKQMSSSGYAVCKEEFREIKQSRSCRYFHRDGFTFRSLRSAMSFDLKRKNGLARVSPSICKTR